ncbi:MAG: 16S rRNA methyltransferase [Ktedonobacterales bacterium]|nr:16S rRNA methyltransferase [Ktedonobacterales bacterium]
MPTDALEVVMAALAASPKYVDVAPDLVRRLAVGEIAKRRTAKEATKATKEKLHQIGGAFLSPSLPYARWLADLRAAPDAVAQRAVCTAIMANHTSMRERLPFLTDFYAAIFADLPPIHSVLDVACGLHPLAALWMPLAPGAAYHASDIYGSMMGFLGEALGVLGIAGQTTWADASVTPPRTAVDLAFVLKALPTLEQLDRDAGRRLLLRIDARYLVVSFPRQSLGGRQKGMSAFYEAHFQELIVDQPWDVRRLTFPTELVFIIAKR